MKRFKVPFSIIMDAVSIIEAENLDEAVAKAKRLAIDGTLSSHRYVHNMEEDAKSISVQFNKIEPEQKEYIVSFEMRTLGKIKVRAKDSMVAEEIVESLMESGEINELHTWEEADEQKKILRVVEV